MRADYANDDTLAEYLKNSKSALFNYFHKYYMNKATPGTSPSSTPAPLPVPSPSPSMSSTLGSSKKSSTARYRRKDKPAVNELKEYFKLPLEDFDACDPTSEEIQPTLLALSSLLKVLKVPKVSKCWTLLAGRSPSLSTLSKRIKGTVTLSKGTKALNKSDSINCKSFKK